MTAVTEDPREATYLFQRNNNTKFVKRHVVVASEALANRTVEKHSSFLHWAQRVSLFVKAREA